MALTGLDTDTISTGIGDCIDWMGAALNSMASQPILVAFFALSCIGVGVGAFRRLRRL